MTMHRGLSTGHSRSGPAVISARVVSHVRPGQSQGLCTFGTCKLDLHPDFVCFLATRNYMYAEFA